MRSSPIADRLAQLHEQWRFFTERAEARLLVWRAADEEEALIDAFIAQECEAETAGTPDLFVQLTTRFRSEPGQGSRLAEELHSLYEEASRLPRAEEAVPWRYPTRQSSDDVGTFVSELVALRSHLIAADSRSMLAVWLMPSEVCSWEAYLLWLQRVMHRTPASIRFLVVDSRAMPRYAPLADVDAVRVFSQVCDLSVFNAMEEMVAAEPGDTPGAALRRLQTACAARIAAGDLEGAVQAGASASLLAKAQGWPHLAAVTSMMLAGAFSAQQKPNEALASYAEAESLGVERETQESASTDEPAYGTRIRLQARLGQGAVLLSCRAYKYAAVAYEQSAKLAHQLADAPIELDAHRLASLCHSQLGDAKAAWELGLRGLQLGIAMDEQTRGRSTLVYLAEDLIRLTEHYRAYNAQRRPLEEHLSEVLGPRWRDQLLHSG